MKRGEQLENDQTKRRGEQARARGPMSEERTGMNRVAPTGKNEKEMRSGVKGEEFTARNDTHQCTRNGDGENPAGNHYRFWPKKPVLLFYTRLMTGKKPWSYSECRPGEEGTVGCPPR